MQFSEHPVAEVHFQQEAAFENLQEVIDLNLSLSLPHLFLLLLESGINQLAAVWSFRVQRELPCSLWELFKALSLIRKTRKWKMRTWC
jgi:hypothetical protein